MTGEAAAAAAVFTGFLHIYKSNNPQLDWHLQFLMSGSIMHSDDKWSNPKMGPSNELKRQRCFSWGPILKAKETASSNSF